MSPNDTNIKPVKKLKGLVKPQYVSNGPLDLLFQELEELFKNVETQNEIFHLYNKLKSLPKLPEIRNNISIFDEIKLLSETNDEFEKRYFVIETLLNYLIKIKELSQKAKEKHKMRSDTLAISLHDIKTFGKLVNYIVVEGVYSCLPSNIGISLEKRRINEFKKDRESFKQIKINKISGDNLRLRLIKMIVEKFYAIFSDDNNDVKDLLLKGVGYTDFLICTVYLLFNPSLTIPNDFKLNLLDKIESFSNTFELIEIYSLLINPKNVSPWFKQICIKRITYLPLKRQSGVLALIEFLTGMRYNDEISIGKFQMVNKVLLSKPNDVPTIDYFENISGQIYSILMMINRPTITSVCINFMEVLFGKNPRILVDFFFKKVWDNCDVSLSSNFDAKKFENNEEMLSYQELDGVVKVNFSILKNNNNNKLIELLFSNKCLIIFLWNYYTFLTKNKLNFNFDILKEIFRLFFLTSDLKTCEVSLICILDNLLIGLNNYPWNFKVVFKEVDKSTQQVIVIVYESIESKELMLNQNSKEKIFNDINFIIDTFLEFVNEYLDENLIQRLFIIILKKWLLNDKREKILDDDEILDSFKMLVNLRLLQNMSMKFKDQINNNENMLEVLDIVYTILSNFNTATDTDEADNEADSDDEVDEINDGVANLLQDTNQDSILKIILEILAFILSNNQLFKLIDINIIEKLDLIYNKLEKLNTKFLAESIKNLKNEITEIKKINENLLSNQTLSKKETIIKLNKIQQNYENEIKLYDDAMKNLNNSIVPVKAHGLKIISDLIANNSKIIDLNDGINIYLEQLNHNDPFIYLSSIKGMTKLIELNMETSLPILIKIYSKDYGKHSTDTILKVGEVVNNFLLKWDANPIYGDKKNLHNSMIFPKPLTELIFDSLINLIKLNGNEKTDNHIRYSALSILETCFKINLNESINYLQDCLDIAIGILTFETSESEDEILMRHGAIKLIMGIVNSKISLKDIPKGYGKKIMISLNYIKTTDKDLLIRNQATECLEEIKEVFKESVIE